MRLLAVSLGTSRRAQIEKDIAEALKLGWSVDLVVTKAGPWAAVPAEVRRHELGEREGQHPILRLERLLVLSAPRLVYEFVRRVLSVLSRAPGRPGRSMKRLQGLWKQAWIAAREGTARFHKERWGAAYGQVRPFVLWRTARRHVVPQLPVADFIVVGDGLSAPIGWQLVRRWPHAGVGFNLAEAHADLDRRAAPG